MKNDQFKQTENYLVGIVPGSHYKAEQQYVLENKPDNLVVEQYCNKPEDFYKKAKFFVLPAEIVFANHALLEAMSYGVVPLVSDQPGSELIVEDGKNGFIYNHNKKDFEETLLKALRLPDEDYQRLSFAAVEKIKTEFSEEKYKQGLKQLYELLNVTE